MGAGAEAAASVCAEMFRLKNIISEKMKNCMLLLNEPAAVAETGNFHVFPINYLSSP